jgi:hypothetical protein
VIRSKVTQKRIKKGELERMERRRHSARRELGHGKRRPGGGTAAGSVTPEGERAPSQKQSPVRSRKQFSKPLGKRSPKQSRKQSGKSSKKSSRKSSKKSSRKACCVSPRRRGERPLSQRCQWVAVVKEKCEGVSVEERISTRRGERMPRRETKSRKKGGSVRQIPRGVSTKRGGYRVSKWLRDRVAARIGASASKSGLKSGLPSGSKARVAGSSRTRIGGEGRVKALMVELGGCVQGTVPLSAAGAKSKSGGAGFSGGKKKGR